VLFIRNGTMTCLEGFTYRSEAWPSDMHHDPPSSAMLRRCAERDIEQLRAMWKPSNAEKPSEN
jgi:hypothetical protein